MSKENKTKVEDSKEEIMERNTNGVFRIYAESGGILKAMDEYAEIKSRERAIAFFKWYGVKMMGFIEYIKDIRPVVTSNEIEEKIAEFEGQTIDNLYNLFCKSEQTQSNEYRDKETWEENKGRTNSCQP
jgi:hypothetical protein